MKKRIYKKWLKNPLNKRLVWKFCKPFDKIPVAHVRSHGWKEIIEALEKQVYDISAVPKEAFKNGLQQTSGNCVSERFKQFVKETEGDYNVKRTRHYGIRIGDIVRYNVPGSDYDDGTEYVVVKYGFMDNNRVYLSDYRNNILPAVAEWCQIVLKVEDRK